jgi:hypothetical protein
MLVGSRPREAMGERVRTAGGCDRTGGAPSEYLMVQLKQCSCIRLHTLTTSRRNASGTPWRSDADPHHWPMSAVRPVSANEFLARSRFAPLHARQQDDRW